MNLLKAIFSILALGAVVVLFQNCEANRSFTSNGKLQKSSGESVDLDDVELTTFDAGDEDEGNTDAESPDGDDGMDTGNSQEPDSNNQANNGNNESENDSEGDGDDSSDDNSQETADTPEGEEDDSEEPRFGQYICLLDGPGRSIRLGLVESKAAAQHGVPSSLCMTKFACETLVAEKFKVKMALESVQCEKKKAHVIHIDDAGLSTLLEAL